MNGIKIEGEKVLCAVCGTTVGKGLDFKASYCPKCGNPLNFDAIEELETKGCEEKLQLLKELLEEIDQTKKSPIEVINQFIKELNDNING